MFVSIQDFIGTDFNIPNMNQVQAKFTKYMQDKEEEVLLKILGVLLYDDLKAGMILQPIPEKWLRLRDGYKFLYGVNTYHFKGLKYPLAGYIYANWLMDTTVKYTGVAMMIPDVENGEVVSPARAIVDAWNLLARTVGNKNERIGPTLYGFTKWNMVDYPNIQYYDFGIERINAFGL